MCVNNLSLAKDQKNNPMKKIYTLLLVLTIAVTSTAYAQKGLNIGVSGSFISPSIVNQNTWGNGHEYDYEITFSSNYGFDIGYNFTSNLGIHSGFSFYNLGQDYSDSYDNKNWKRSLKFSYNVIPIMFRYTSSTENIKFIGSVGVLYAMLNKAEQTWTGDGVAYHEEGTTLVSKKTFDLGADDVTNRFSKTDIILNIELGIRIETIDNLYIDAVLNAGYGLTDINDEDYHFEDKDGNYNPSHNFLGGFKVGVAYVLFGE